MLAPGMDSVGRAVKDAFIAGAYDAPLPPTGVTMELPADICAWSPVVVDVAGSAGILPASTVCISALAGSSPGGSAVILVLPCRTIAAAPCVDAPLSNCRIAPFAVSTFVGA